MAYLGIDYGTKRIGLAYGFIELGIAFPLPAITYENQTMVWPLFSALIKDKKITHIVLGLPLNMDDSEGKSAQMVREFADQLTQHFSLPIFLSDERLTTYAATPIKKQNSLKKIKKDRHSGKIDSQAAVLILQDYFNEQSLYNHLS